jgi:predicted permease
VKLLRVWVKRVRGLWGSTRSERELAVELESHLQFLTDDYVKGGMTPEEARRRAHIKLGGLEQTKERYRDRRGIPTLESIFRDLRYGGRSLMKTPGFTIAGVVIIGLGVGVNSAIFTVVNSVVFTPLPFAQPDRIVRLWHTPPPLLFAGSPVFALSPANFIDWEQQNHVFERMAIYRVGRQVMTGSGEPDAVVTYRASADFLPILGVSPTLGRGFTRDDDVSGGRRTALLADAFFRSRFGGDPSTIGKTILLDRIPYTVIGVVPDAPVFIDSAQVYVPLAWTAEERAVRNNHNYRGIAKLKPGIDVRRANADLAAISKRLEAQYPEDNKDWGALVLPLQEDLLGDTRQSLLVLLGAVGLVLLIACANVANLLLVRTHGRAQEIALRGALGAGRTRVVQQFLVEGLLLGVAGGLAGFAAAYYAVELFKATFGTALPRMSEVVVDMRVLAFTTAAALIAGLASAFVPAWRLTGRDANDALKAGASRGNSAGGDFRVKNLLVVSEVALALMLLIGAGLLIRSLNGLRAVDPGFDARNVLTATVSVPEAKYATPQQRNQFFDRVLQNVRALPGVVSAALVDTLPLQGGSSQYVTVEGMPAMKESELPVVALRLASPGYFETARIGVRAGRDFTDADGYGRPRVVIVSESTAKRFWPGEDPLGKRVTLTMMTNEPAEVVGVVREVKTGSLDASEADSETAIYAPAAQFAYGGSSLAVRTVTDPRTLTRSLIDVVRAIDAEVPVLDIMTLDEVVEESLGQRPLATILLSGFALLALLLASVGVYSVLAYTVRQRVREIGIRMALGAPTGGVLRLIVIQGLKPTIVGVVLGLAMASAVTRVMSTLLFGIGQHDPGTFGAVALTMLAVGALATALPAYRATRVDPVRTLRAE